jgi:hypothetical protein
MTPTVMNVAFLASITLLSYTAPASAYLDPGTGSMMLQALLGGIAGAAVVGRLYWHRLKTSLTSRFSAKRRDAGANSPEQ